MLVSSFVFDRTFSCLTPLPYSLAISFKISASPPLCSVSFVCCHLLRFSATQCSEARYWWFSLCSIGIGPSEVGEDLLVYPQHVVFYTPDSSVCILKHSWHVVVRSHSLEKAAKVVKLSNWIPSKRFSIPISLMVLNRLVRGSGAMTSDCRVVREILMSGPLVFRFPVLSCCCSWHVWCGVQLRTSASRG